MKGNKRKKAPGTDYIRYSGIAFQMIFVILLFTYAGVWLDKQIQGKIPAFTILFILAGIAVSFYLILKTLKR